MSARDRKPLGGYPGWQSIIDAINQGYAQATGVPCPWANKRAFRMLHDLVNGNPWSAETWVECVRNLYLSDDINHAAPPELIIPKLPCYVRGPLNRFHELKRNGQTTKTEQRTARNISAARAAWERIAGTQETNPQDAGGDSGSDGGGIE